MNSASANDSEYYAVQETKLLLDWVLQQQNSFDSDSQKLWEIHRLFPAMYFSLYMGVEVAYQLASRA